MLARPGYPGVTVALALALMACASGTPAAAPGRGAPAAGGSARAPAAGGANAPGAAPGEAGAPAANAPASADAPPLVTLKIAAQPSIPSAARYVAIERGYFREEGIEMEEVPSTTSAQMLPSLAAGQVDMGLGGAAAGLFNAIAQGIPVRMTLDMWTAYPDDRGGGLIMRKDLVDGGQVRDFGDLAGLRIAVTSKGHATEYALDRGLSKGGLSLADVEMTELSYPDMNVALGNRNIDGAVTIEPYGTQAVVQGFAARFKPWPDLILYDTPATIMFSESFAETRTDLARRFAKAYVRGLRDYDQARAQGKDREAVIAIIQKHVPFLERPMYDQIPWPPSNPDGRVNADAIAAAQDWFAEHGYVQTKVDLTKVVDNQFADYAVAQLGPYQP
jgi:NitT/TauT family transport system substrate-binding protein